MCFVSFCTLLTTKDFCWTILCMQISIKNTCTSIMVLLPNIFGAFMKERVPSYRKENMVITLKKNSSRLRMLQLRLGEIKQKHQLELKFKQRGVATNNWLKAGLAIYKVSSHSNLESPRPLFWSKEKIKMNQSLMSVM